MLAAREFPNSNARTSLNPSSARKLDWRKEPDFILNQYGVERGVAYGASDDIGLTVADKPVHVHDFHATILHLLGLDHERLTYQHAGRAVRLHRRVRQRGAGCDGVK